MIPRTIPNKADGTFDLNQLEDYIRPTNDPHQPYTGLIAVEDTHGNCGGKVLPVTFLAEVTIALLNTGRDYACSFTELDISDVLIFYFVLFRSSDLYIYCFIINVYTAA